ncbi:MFS transporter [Pedococcus ginsenosidimutans]|uniref:MFS transporter n=1 Tax=Pedococcus ginsenosidimutans TaxID=490570 RepID=A0ABP8XYV1_9MICO
MHVKPTSEPRVAAASGATRTGPVVARHHGHTAADTHPGAGEDGQRQPWLVLALALAAQILVVLDISVVNTALPAIGRDLKLDGSAMQWVVTAYLMMSGGGLLFGGRIADLLSRKWVFLSGLTVFTIASIVSGLADGAGELIAARAGQGLAAALMTPAALSIIMTTYSGAQRRLGLTLWGAVGSLGVAAGVLLGGALTTWGGWQTIFFINAPVGAVALVAGLKVIPAATTPAVTLRQFDVAGATTVIGSLAALVYGLGATEQHGWLSARVLAALTTSAVLAVAFKVRENRAANPLVPPHTWKVTSLVSGTTVMLGVSGILVGTVFLASIFVQTLMGFSPIRAGVAFVPFALAITAGTVVARHAMAHGTPRAVASTGLVVLAGGALLLTQASAGSSFATGILPGLATIGLGVGMVFAPVSVSAMAGIPPQHAGMASGFLMTGHEVGAALGVAVLSAVASTAGSLTSATGVVDGFDRGFLAAAVIALVLAVFAYLRMPATRVEGGAGMHMHH